MRKMFTCRRSTIALVAIGCLTWLGLYRGIDVSLAIAGVVASIAGANSFQGAAEAKAAKLVEPTGEGQ